MQRRSLLIATAASLAASRAFAHHGWSSFDQSKPIYLAGQAAKVAWRNPHVEIDLELAADLKLPADLAQRVVPAQSAPVDGPQLLRAASVPKRKDRRWEIEFAPLTRMQAWAVPEIKVGDKLEVLGFTFPNEQGEAILRVEYLWLGGKTYGLRSSPA
ncbi:hypothetical protein HLB44_07065 [Aquincola sp. S2]|uniref:Copper-binding protein n=1 Tax=Pseudaquabacterium terrae TaxID=2732868 RepID=A0ABX2ED92_9BURK|nr:DUF6152 family protein [Aquabacterium terrae]NRF66738.1 hypothetical protein [Aquabacterium terrae]